MALSRETIEYQNKLARYCRTGEPVKIDGTVNSRLHHYRRLVFNVVNNTLAQAYPITREVLDPKVWNNLVNSFFSDYNPQSPYLWKMPKEFYRFIKNSKYSEKLELPFLNDLLYFEWIEIEVYTMPDAEVFDYSGSGNIYKDILIINQEFRLINLDYPVHMYSVEEAKNKRGNYYVLVYREPVTFKVKFINLSVLNAFIFEQLAYKSFVVDIVKDIRTVFKITDVNKVRNHVLKFINSLLKQRAILGYRNISN